MKTVTNRLIIGGAFVIIGVFLVLRNFGVLNFEIPFDLFSWELIFVVIGTILVATSSRIFPGIIFIAIGFLSWYPELWPLILIAIGISVIYKRSDSKKSKLTGLKENFSGDILDDVAVFGGGHKIIESDNFRGGEAVAVFGGSEIDLTNCKLAEGTQQIELVAVFGGATFIVPKNWNVQIDVVSIFGGFSDKRRFKDPDTLKDRTSSLKITGVVIFGGGEVK